MATFVVYVNLPMLLPELPMKRSGTIISPAATQHTTFQIEALDWTQIGTALDEAVGSVTDAPDQRSGKLAIRPSGGLLSERRLVYFLSGAPTAHPALNARPAEYR